MSKKENEEIYKPNAAFPDGSVVENLPAKAVDMGLTPDLWRAHMLRNN